MFRISRRSKPDADFSSSSLHIHSVPLLPQSGSHLGHELPHGHRRAFRLPSQCSRLTLTSVLQMWSLGCIIAEMYTGYPIFPGENEQEQLACIMEVMGLPDKYLVDRSSRKRLFFGKLASLSTSPSVLTSCSAQTLRELLGRSSTRKAVAGAPARRPSPRCSSRTTSPSSTSSPSALRGTPIADSSRTQLFDVRSLCRVPRCSSLTLSALQKIGRAHV